MRNENGFGSVTKLSGNRKKPYAVRVSEIVQEGHLVLETEKSLLSRRISALDEASVVDVVNALHPDDGLEWIKGILEEEFKKQTFKGKQKQKYIGYYATKKEAQIALAEWNKQELKIDSLEYTFNDVWELVKNDIGYEGMKRSTQQSYKNGYDKCKPLYDTQIVKLKLDDLQSVIDRMSGASKPTIANAIKVIKAVYDYAFKRELVSKDYSQHLRYPQQMANKAEKNVFSHSEIERLRMMDDKMAKYTLMMCYLGCRIEEFMSIKEDDIHDGYIWVNGTKNSTSKRYVAIHPDIADLVNEMLPVKDYKTSQFRKEFCRSNPGHTPHDCRHTFATYSAVCMDRTLREYQLGHRLAGMDNVYVHPEMLIPQIKEAICNLKM